MNEFENARAGNVNPTGSAVEDSPDVRSVAKKKAILFYGKDNHPSETAIKTRIKQRVYVNEGGLIV